MKNSFKNIFSNKKLKKSPASQPGVIKVRNVKIIGFVLLFFLHAIALRAVLIQWFPIYETNLNPIADKQYFKYVDLAPYRGAIYDRRREPLAISTRLPSVFINPKVFQPNYAEIVELSKILKTDVGSLRKIQQKNSYFAWLARKISREDANRILNLKLKGIEIITEPNRYYPGGRYAANLIGMVGMDDKGLVGMERQYDRELSGTPSRLHIARDARGQTIFRESHEAAPENPGHDLHLTIDRAIQEIAEEELERGVLDAQAQGGFAIISDPHTGRILALANSPNFDPNNNKNVDLKKTINKALMDGFEPGSVIKTFVIAEALRQKKITPESRFDCEGGTYEAGGVKFSDSHKPPEQFLSATDTLVHSSNVCVFKIAEIIGQESLYTSLQRFGFGGKLPTLGFPGEAKAYISSWQDWKPIRFANIAFGQGFFSNALEVTQAFGALANGGNLMKPYIVSKIESASGQIIKTQSSEVITRVLNPQNARQMRTMLQHVVDDGVKNAQLSMHTSGGKTGTSEKVDPKTKAYSKTKRIASFAGITPISDPHLVIYVAIDEPGKAPYYGNLRAAPVFKRIAERTLSYLNVAPDKTSLQSEEAMLKPGPKVSLLEQD